MGYALRFFKSGTGNVIIAAPASATGIQTIRGVAGGTDPLSATVFSGAGQWSNTVTVGGSITAGDVLTVYVNSGLVSQAIVYTVINTDTTSTIATAIGKAINANAVLTQQSVIATVSSAVVTVDANFPFGNTAFLSVNVPGGATETLTVGSASTSIVTASETQLATLRTNAINQTDQVTLGFQNVPLGNAALMVTFVDADTTHEVWIYLA